MTERFVLALVGPPFGLTGRVKIDVLSGEFTHMLELKKVTLRKNKGNAQFPEREFNIEQFFTLPLSIKFAGVDTPEAARALKGAEILVPREQAAPLNKDEFYIEDLRGIDVYYQDSVIGTISDIIEGGAGFLAEISLTEVSLIGGQTRLVPFRNEFFGKVDLVKGRVELLNTWILE